MPSIARSTRELNWWDRRREAAGSEAGTLTSPHRTHPKTDIFWEMCWATKSNRGCVAPKRVGDGGGDTHSKRG
jgi:hypothetical protein